jgi:hypothetical protein
VWIHFQGVLFGDDLTSNVAWGRITASFSEFFFQQIPALAIFIDIPTGIRLAGR